MRILLTGASGLVGAAFARAAAAAHHSVVAVVGRYPEAVPGATEQWSRDLSSIAHVRQTAIDARPDAIVNCAAVSEPQQCEHDPDLAWRLNVQLPGELARMANHLRARFVHVSTEQVFSGQRGPYAITDAPGPLNLYGRQKLESERAVAAMAPARAATVRAPLLNGNSLTGQRSLHERLLALWGSGRAADLFVDEIRQVATADNLAAALLELCQRPELCGVFHWAGLEPLSRYELGLRLRAHFGLPPIFAPMTALARHERPHLTENRPADLRLDLGPLRATLTTRAQTLDEQLPTLQVPPHLQAWWRSVSTHCEGPESETI